jgi:hypothetical protein
MNFGSRMNTGNLRRPFKRAMVRSTRKHERTLRKPLDAIECHAPLIRAAVRQINRLSLNLWFCRVLFR